MDNTLLASVTIETKNDDEKMRIGSNIHEQLRGNQDYIDCLIILNIDEPNIVRLWVDKRCKEIPNITLNLIKD